MRVLFVFLFWPLFLSGEVLILDSDIAEFDQGQVNLKGHVHLVHDMGSLSAGEATLLPGLKGKMKTAFVELLDCVLVHLKCGGTLSSATAHIDNGKGLALFHSNERQLDVIYRDNYQNGSAEAAPVAIYAKSMRVEFSKEGMRAVDAYGSVRIHYAQNYMASGAHSRFSRLSSNGKDKDRQFFGLASLDPGEVDGAYCVMESIWGDRIEAKSVNFDIKKKQIYLFHPHGYLSNRQKESDALTLNFSAGELTFEEEKDLLVLTHDVILEQDGLGTLTTDGRVDLVIDRGRKPWPLSSARSYGHTCIKHFVGDETLAHTIDTDGDVLIDHENLFCRITGAKRQVHFRDLIGEIYADSVTVFYSVGEKRICPKKILVKGNIRLMNGEVDTQGIYQLALGDYLEYYPEKHTIKLSADSGQRVLFWDKLNAYRFSAPAIEMSRHEGAKQGKVKGIGDIRFRFLDKELALFKERFAFLIHGEDNE